MIGMMWVVLFVALTGSHLGYGLPVRPTPLAYPHDGQSVIDSWTSQGGLYTTIPALALVLTAVAVLIGCTWCYRHKDCKPNEGADNQLFTGTASHLNTQRVHAPDSGFHEPVNNNITEDNNNGPISLREMQNIANNNATAYIVSENEERNRARESVVEFEPLPNIPLGADPLEHCADWFACEDFPRNGLQYLREIRRGWFGRIVAGEIEVDGSPISVAVRILNPSSVPHERAQYLDEAKLYRVMRHEQIMRFYGQCIREDPWLTIFELCTMDLQNYLIINRPRMNALNESGVPLQIMCDVTSALAHIHAHGYTYGRLWSGSIAIRGEGDEARAMLGRYEIIDPQHDCFAPEVLGRGHIYTTQSEMWSVGTLIWEICSWGSIPTGRTSPPPDLPCPYKSHLYQVMQLCWNLDPAERPSAEQVYALIQHLHATHTRMRQSSVHADVHEESHFEDRWQRLKPNTIPKLDEHVAIVHAPSNAELENPEPSSSTLTVNAAVSRSSSIMSDREPLSSAQLRSESLNNLHGSLEDVRNIYLTHNETPLLECHQGNVLESEREADRSDASVDPWLKDIIAGSQDDVSYYRDVSDVIKNLDNILNSEKTSSSESSHQASPSRDNLSLDCKKEYPVQSSLVKSPGISNFQNILDTGFGSMEQPTEPEDDEMDRDTIGTLSHSFERHSDTTSQQTLENLTPDTPMKDVDVFGKIEVQVEIERLDEGVVETPFAENTNQNEVRLDIENDIEDNVESTTIEYTESESVENTASKPVEDIEPKSLENKDPEILECKEPECIDSELPKQTLDSKVPALKELCKVTVPRVSEVTEDQLNVKDCETSCDTAVRTDNGETKSVAISETDSKPLDIEVTDLLPDIDTKIPEEILPKLVEDSTISNEGIDTLPSVTEDVSNQENDASLIKLESNIDEPESMETENNYSKDETILISDLIDTLTDNSSKEPVEPIEIEHITEQTPEPVQNIIEEIEKSDIKNKNANKVEQTPPDTVQTTSENLVNKVASLEKIDNLDSKDNEAMPRSDNFVVIEFKQQSNESTVFMDLINDTNSQILKDSVTSDIEDNEVIKADDNLKDESPVQASDISDLHVTESTVYLDLPSFEVIKKTDDFLHMERMVSDNMRNDIVASTPITSDNSGDITLENSIKESETLILSETKIPDVDKEQRSVYENVSPFESPSKSHHTDTYDENSSVVLGPFENCSLEVIKTGKGNVDLVELPKEELLAFSSNFSEMNLETPSPLRDGNFLNEVPDIIPDDVQFDDIASISEAKPDPPSEETEATPGTEKRVSPSTPPNSPGIFLASTSQPTYLVDIEYNEVPDDPPSNSMRDEIDLNQIELQITSKLAMAENENNMNIEYSGPLTVEGVIEEGEIARDSDAIPETYLAGNGDVMNVREDISLDEECVKALRNELELKLPLAQVAAIEPQLEGDGNDSELPPPPELIVSYPGALSPIQEETGQQLSAYENDAQWNASIRTDSSSSYPEPCNTEPTEQTRDHTYTLPEHDRDQRTYTLHRDIATSSREITMSADSLNGSPSKIQKDTTLSPIDDHTYTKDEVIESNCERISQVSPFLVSPTTDTALSDNCDNATGVSTLSKTTIPTDAKLSKPTETQCLSKATSIDSWCSNDTLYNVEENFDDLAMDPDVPIDFDKDEGNSESTDTLTHNDDEKEHSHCSTYIIHDSKSEGCETFSPDSITANDNYTYTKVKAGTGTTPSNNTDLNDSTKNTQTKDLAYGTLMSGIPSYSNCTTDIASGFEDAWKLPQPELVRKSPIHDDTILSPPKLTDFETTKELSSPQTPKPTIDRIESVEISCLEDNFIESPNQSETETKNIDLKVSPNDNYKNMTPSLTSTPLIEIENADDVQAIPMKLPENKPEHIMSVSSFQAFEMSAEVKPQDLSTIPQDLSTISQDLSTIPQETNQDTTLVLTGENTPSQTNNSEGHSGHSSSYANFENSAITKAQDLNSLDGPSNVESGNSTGFRNFENSAVTKAQDLNSLEGPSQVESGNSTGFQNFENSVINKAQDLNSFEGNVESGISTGFQNIGNSTIIKTQDLNSLEASQTESCNSTGFRSFEDSVKTRPQDLSSIIHVSPIKEQMTPETTPIKEQILPETTPINEQMSTETTTDTNASQIKTEQQSLDISPPNFTNLVESHEIVTLVGEPQNTYLINFGNEDETEQPHSIIITEIPMSSTKLSANRTYDSHEDNTNATFNSHVNIEPELSNSVIEKENSVLELNNSVKEKENTDLDVNNSVQKLNGDIKHDKIENLPEIVQSAEVIPKNDPETSTHNLTNGSLPEIERIAKVDTLEKEDKISSPIQLENSKDEYENSKSERFATVNFLNETFEELIESNVDEEKDDKSDDEKNEPTLKQVATPINNLSTNDTPTKLEKPENSTESSSTIVENGEHPVNGISDDGKMAAVTEDFLQNEKNYCQHNAYIPMLSDIRFTGPATEIMSTSFQESPTSPTSPDDQQEQQEQDRQNKPDVADIMKDWDSDTDSHSSNSSSGEFIWKDGDGHETSVVPSTHFEHQRSVSGGESNNSGNEVPGHGEGAERQHDGAESGSGSASGSGSEGDEVEFVPSSWDCRAAPAKSSLRSLEHAHPQPDSKKRVVFKRQKYHCVYEYPREVNDLDPHSPYLPDFSTYSEWDPSSAEEAELCYGQLFSSPSALSANYPLRAGIAFGSDYDEDFFISSSARPFESLGIMSTTSQFFPGMHVKGNLLERQLSDEGNEDFPPPSPLTTPLPTPTTTVEKTPSLDFTTPDSGVEDITPGSMIEEDFKKLVDTNIQGSDPWKLDSGESSESISPSSPASEALGGLRHTRDKLKLDLPPSPHLASPRHSRVFNFVLEKPKRSTPLVMTDETPILAPIPLPQEEEPPLPTPPPPTFSTFGKTVQKVEPEQKIILTDEIEQTEVKEETPKVVETVKGEGTVLDSGDEDSGIESSSKATLERNKPHLS